VQLLRRSVQLNLCLQLMLSPLQLLSLFCLFNHVDQMPLQADYQKVSKLREPRRMTADIRRAGFTTFFVKVI
jgi:hypothetical protein